MKPEAKVRKMRLGSSDGDRTKASKRNSTSLRRTRHEVAVLRANKETT